MEVTTTTSTHELRPGTLEMLVLKTLSIRSMHGYGIAQHIQTQSADVLTVEEGALYPVLQRMLVTGWVSAEWKILGNDRRARFYGLTAAGKKQLGFEHSRTAGVAVFRQRAMAPGLVAIVGVMPLTANCGAALTSRPVLVPDRALEFFIAHIRSNVTRDIAALRPPPVGPAAVRQVLSTLPADGALHPTADEARALAALGPILRFHERDDVIVAKIIDVPQAVIGLHARAVLLISRPALRILTIPELQAAVAHEIGHDFFWAEYIRLRERPERRSYQQMELRCDGIAVVTLVALDLDPARLVPAVRTLTRFNERLGAQADAEYYPSLAARAEFVRALSHHVDALASSTRTARAR